MVKEVRCIMDIRLLKYFLAVAREENITRAAEKLYISQPSLSKQLIELEKELGKKLLVRGKRKITLTEEGVILRKRAEEIVSLLEKTEREIGSDLSNIEGEISIGGNPAKTILKTASNLVKKYNGVKFNFYSGDAEDVCERLEHGSLDFAILLEPVDSVKYDYISLPDGSEWGILMSSSDCKLAKQQFITKENLKSLPLILHRRIGLQRVIAKWADINLEDLNIVASYNVVQGSPISFVESGLGYFLTTKDLIEKSLNENVCFIPLKPKLTTKYALVWKRYPIFTKPANAFLEEIKSILK